MFVPLYSSNELERKYFKRNDNFIFDCAFERNKIEVFQLEYDWVQILNPIIRYSNEPTNNIPSINALFVYLKYTQFCLSRIASHITMRVYACVWHSVCHLIYCSPRHYHKCHVIAWLIEKDICVIQVIASVANRLQIKRLCSSRC